MKKESKTVETWMPFLIDKYLGDTTDLSTEQHGAYVLLLLSAWKKGGVLPNDDNRLAAITKLSPERWKEHKAILLEFFKVGPEGLTQKRLSEELERAKANVEQRSAAGKASAAAKAAAKAGNGTSTVVATDVGTSDATELPTEPPTDSGREPQRNVKPIPIPSSSLRSEEKGAVRKPTFDASGVELPEWLDPGDWVRWCKDRKKRGKAITEEAARLQIKKLDAFRQKGAAPAAVIDFAIEHGHQGFFYQPPVPHRGLNGTPNKHAGAAKAIYGDEHRGEIIDV